VLARRLGVAHVELDALAWGPGWSVVPDEAFRERVARAVAGDAWVIDGNYSGRGARELVWSRADTVVWLDPPLHVILWRLLGRALRRIRTREELWPGTGNRETYRGQFLSRDTLFWWAIKGYRRRRRELPRTLARAEYAHLAIHRLRTGRDAETWLSRI
jgi:adenylate kinase family enzyme